LKQLTHDVIDYWPVDWQRQLDEGANPVRAVEHVIAEHHPELDADALSALSWYSSYCNK
jgi:hypothetical protein